MKIKTAPAGKTSDGANPPVSDQQSLTFKQRLFIDGGEGLSNILIWVNIFASAWLVSGIVLENILLFSQIFVPLMALFLLAKNKEQIEQSLRGRVFLVSLPIKIVASVIYVAYFNYQYSRADLSVLLLITTITLILQNYLAPKEQRNTIAKVVLFGFLILILTTTLSLLGISSQQEQPLEQADLIYLVLGLMPGLVLMSRQYLIDSQAFLEKRWVFENTFYKNDKEKSRPGGISRIVIGTFVLGAAIPSLLLPLKILPQSLFIVTLSFYFVPNLALTIQKEKGALDERVLKITLFAALITLLTYVGAYLSRFGFL